MIVAILTTHTILLTDIPQDKELTSFETIVNVGVCAEILKADTQQQLNLIQEKLKFDYILFQGIFFDGIYKPNENTIYGFHDYEQIISYLNKIKLKPFIQINISDLIQNNIEIPTAKEVLSVFFKTISRYSSKAEIEKWKFEITSEQLDNFPLILKYYQEFFLQVKKYSPKIQIGIIISDKHTRVNDVLIRDTLHFFKQHDCYPSFLILKIDPNMVIGDLNGVRTHHYQEFKNYHLTELAQLQKILDEENYPSVPLYLTEWNTLAGSSYIESASFYRSALIIEALLDISEKIKGISYWLSEYGKERVTSKVTKNNVLSLFHCYLAKRSTYFILNAYAKLGGRVIFRNENILITKGIQGDITIMILNSCYFNPAQSLNYDYMSSQGKEFFIVLKELEVGRYIIKTYQFTMSFTFAVNNNKMTHGMGFYQSIDEDVLDYVQNMSSPKFFLFEEEIKNEYIIRTQLATNAVLLYTLKKVS